MSSGGPTGRVDIDWPLPQGFVRGADFTLGYYRISLREKCPRVDADESIQRRGIDAHLEG